jgi:hypothetical protein
MKAPSFREINAARRSTQAFHNFRAFYRRRGLRGAAASGKARNTAARIHGAPPATR